MRHDLLERIRRERPEGNGAHKAGFDALLARSDDRAASDTGGRAVCREHDIGIVRHEQLGSLLVAAVILGLSQFKQISSEGIVLAGVAISSMLTGATTLLQYFADEVALSSLVFWTFGDLGSTDWQSLRGMALAVLLLIVYCYLHRWDYNALLSGEETALSLGIHVRRLTLTNVVLTCFVCSVIVSHVGLINFIGLVAPHIVRMVVGNNYIYLIPGSVLAGAALLLLSDLAARVIIMPVILPIGALTAFLGGPLFLYLLFKGRRQT